MDDFKYSVFNPDVNFVWTPHTSNKVQLTTLNHIRAYLFDFQSDSLPQTCLDKVHFPIMDKRPKAGTVG